MEKTITEKHPRTFAIIGTPDGSRRLWLSRPTEAGHIYATCSFALTGRMAFVDSIDALDYIRVDRVITYDEDISALQLTLLQDPQDCLERLMEDLPKLMEEHLP